MPALNIAFTDDELTMIRHRAETEGVSMRTYAHQTLVTCSRQSDKNARFMAEAARVMELSRDLLDWLAER